MSIARTRSALYKTARVLGDVQAVRRSVRKGSPAPLFRRLLRRIVGRWTGLLLRRTGL
jgi:hypothetical protein